MLKILFSVTSKFRLSIFKKPLANSWESILYWNAFLIHLFKQNNFVQKENFVTELLQRYKVLHFATVFQVVSKLHVIKLSDFIIANKIFIASLFWKTMLKYFYQITLHIYFNSLLLQLIRFSQLKIVHYSMWGTFASFEGKSFCWSKVFKII